MTDQAEAPVSQIPSTLASLAVPIAGLVPYGRNPRRGDVSMIEDSLRRHGQYRAIVVRAGSNEILAGNHTVRAARNLGWPEIAATFVDVDDDTAARIVLIDNAANDSASYDDQALAELLSELAQSPGALEGTGFDEAALDALLRDLDDPDLMPGPEPETVATGILAARYLVPPFSVLDARQGPWRDRKREWLALGLRSGVGRALNLIAENPSGADPDFYRLKSEAEDRLRRKLSTEEFIRDHYRPTDNSVWTSVFDPVLAELCYRWFSPDGGSVLDPFAGGSVRGIVAAALGRAYTGIDVSPEQLAENRRQAAEILPALASAACAPAPEIGGEELTPVELHGGYLVKREDAWSLRTEAGLATGAKARTIARLLAAGDYPGVITAGASISPQIERAALVAHALGRGCRIHTAALLAPSPEISTAQGAGAEILGHSPGRLSVIRARFAADVELHPEWLALPYGMRLREYVEDVAAQVVNIPAEARRIVVPVGSGMTAAGILAGLRDAGRALPVLGVRVGGDASSALDEFAPGWRESGEIELVASPQPYAELARSIRLGELRLDPIYEAKCLPFLAEGDLLWAVGIRSSVAPAPIRPQIISPRWIEGDSRDLDALLRAAPGGEDESFDLLFSCPPYADLEKYSTDPRDLSTLDYPAFLASYREIIAAAVGRLREDRFAVFVVGEVRASRDPIGAYYGFVPDTIAAFENAGARFYNEGILITSAGNAAVRVVRMFNSVRKLGKTHQNVLVFVKGDPRRATAAAGRIELLDLPEPESGQD